MSKKNIFEVMDKVFMRLRDLEIEHEGQKLSFKVKPLTDEELTQYKELIAGGQADSLPRGMDFIFSHCLFDEHGNRIWEKPEEVNLPPIARSILTGKVVDKAIGNDISEFAAKNLPGSAS